jgi:hypothetical protein
MSRGCTFVAKHGKKMEFEELCANVFQMNQKKEEGLMLFTCYFWEKSPNPLYRANGWS